MIDIYSPLTETELITIVSEFYKTSTKISKDKALKIFELEYCFKPEIVEKNKCYVNPLILSNPSLSAYAEIKHFEYMYELQQSGVTNMFNSKPFLLQTFLIDDKTASNIVAFYIKHYDEIYFPERLI